MILIKIKMATLGKILKHGVIASPLVWGATKAIPYLADHFGEFAVGLLPQKTGYVVNGMANVAMSRNNDVAGIVVDFVAQAGAYAALGALAFGLEQATYNTFFE